MTGQNRTPSLLERLAGEVGCLYLSDLRGDQYQWHIRTLVEAIPAEDYPVREWEDALSYLTKRKPPGGSSAKVLKDLLAELLSDP